MYLPLTVVVVNWNHGAYLEACLQALDDQQYPDMEMVVCDNASTDGSAQWLAGFAAGNRRLRVRLLKFADNLGFARAFNYGARATARPLILSLNPDVVVRPGFLTALAQAVYADERVGMAAPRLLRADDPRWLDSSGLFVDRRRRPYDRGQGELDCGRYAAGEVFGACGAAALYRRAMLEDVAPDGEYFDEDFFAYCEDADLSWRAQWRGWRCVYVPEAVATHVRGWGDTLRRQRQRSARGPRMALRNRWLMTIKNDCWDSFLADLPLILSAELVSLAYAGLSRPQVLGGVFDIVREWSAVWRKRRSLLGRRRTAPAEVRRWFLGRR